MDAEKKDSRGVELVARLGLYTASMVVIGSMIGSGIFKKPAVMAAQLPSPTLLLLIWLAAGLITCFGALSNAEVSGMMPEAGGQYVYFRRIYSPFVGYLYGWAIFAVIQTGSIASITYVFSEYAGYFVPLPRLSKEWEEVSVTLLGVIKITPFADIGVKLLTVCGIALLTGINVAAVVAGGAVQNVLTTAKLVAIGAVILLSFSAGSGSFGHLTPPAGTPSVGALGAGGLVSAIGLALSGAFWAFDGWNNVTYIAGEVRNPSRTVPRALFLGTLVVACVYLLTNLAYLYVLPLDRMSGSKLVAADVMREAIGPGGGAFVSALVLLSTLGAANGAVLSSARVYFAMARDGLFFAPLGRLHPRFRTPAISLVCQGTWASLLVFTGTFDQLTDMLIFVSWIFYALGALGVIVARVRFPDLPRPYRVWGYPVVPVVFVLLAVVYVVVSLVGNPRDALFGLLLVAVGLPLYWYWKR
ncbi:MAG: amino acid permease [Deltaproteobacteria bacterium]|nr:amino acid permease [Deltaproteobacteria bacterium]